MRGLYDKCRRGAVAGPSLPAWHRQLFRVARMKALLLAAAVAALQLSPCGALDNGVAELPRMGWS